MSHKHNLSAGSTQSDAPPRKKTHGPEPAIYKNWIGDRNFSCSPAEEKLEKPALLKRTTEITDRMDLLVKAVVGKIFQEIFLCWPLSTNNMQNTAVFVNQWSFYVYAFFAEWRRYKNKNDKAEESLMDTIESLEKSLSIDKFRTQTFNSFKQAANKQKKESIKRSMEDAKKIKADLDDSYNFGLFCQKKAIWIGVERSSSEFIDSIGKKLMIEESASIFSELDAYILEDTQWHRVHAPVNNDSTLSCIFWTKSSSSDSHPTWEKVFGGAIYNPQAWPRKIYDPLNKDIQDDIEGTFKLIRDKKPLNRSITTTGTMVKGLGIQSNHGTLYAPVLDVLKPKSSKPRVETLRRVEEEIILRKRLKGLTPYIQGRDFNVLLGFLPKFAEQQIKTATDAGLLNLYGFPQTSAFGTWAYSACPHLDIDDSVTMGWVTKRSKSISKWESNFVFASHRLVLEMKENMLWFWDATKDAHGTTVNSISGADQSQNPTTQDLEYAQCTRVTVLPHKVVLDSIREQERNEL